MKRLASATVSIVVFVMALPFLVARQSGAADLFHQGLMLERADGKVAEAIFLYERVIAEFPKDKDVVPQALYHLGQLYEQKSDPRALVLFNRLVREYPANSNAASARAKAAELQTRSKGPFKEQDISEFFDGVPEFGPPARPDWAFSPDSRMVAYVKAPGTVEMRSRLYVRDLESGKEHVIFDSPAHRVGTFVWSSDGRTIAVEVRHSASADGGWDRRELHLLVLPGGQDRTVHVASVATWPSQPGAPARDFYRMVWSPDGRFLAFDPDGPNGPGELFLLTRSTRTVRSFGALGNIRPSSLELRWSPDSNRVIFRVRNTADRTDTVHVVTAATGDVQIVSLPQAPRITLGSWKDGDRLVLRQRQAGASQDDLLLLPLNGGPPVKACASGSQGDICQSVLRDGAQALVWRKKSTNFALRDVTTGSEVPLTIGSGEERAAVVSPDGRTVVFASNRDGRWAEYVVPIDAIPVSDPVRVTYLEGDQRAPDARDLVTWASNGRLIMDHRALDWNIFRVNVDVATGRATSRPERLTQDATINQYPVVSPDSQHIAYTFGNGGRGGVAIMDANGANERPLLFKDPARAFQAVAWRSKDEVLFTERDLPTFASSRVLLRALNLSTGLSDVLNSFVAVDGWGTYIPRTDDWYGATLARGANETENVRTLVARSANGTERVIVKAHDIEDWAVSPDGRFIVCGLERVHRQPYELVLFTTQGLEVRTILKSAPSNSSTIFLPRAWSPNGKFLLYEQEDDDSFLHVVNVETGDFWALLDPKGPDAGLNLSEADWSPDGSFVVGNHVDSRRQVRVWDGLTYEGVRKFMSAVNKKK